MKIVILSAGGGTRLKPLINIIPKPLIKICGKSILEHNFENFKKIAKEFIIVVSKKNSNKIKDEIGDDYKGIKINYHTQGIQKGTAVAIKNLEIKGDFVLLNGDTIHHTKDIKKLIKNKNYGALVKQVENPSLYGIFKLDDYSYAKEIIEKPKKSIGNLANIGLYKFNGKIIQLAKKVKKSERGEYELIDCLNLFLKEFDFKLHKSDENLIHISYPWDILNANKYFLEKLKKSKIKGKIEKNVVIKGNIILEKGAILKGGTYIEGNLYIGKNTVIGPNSYIRGNTVIGDSCKIGNAVEIRNSSLGNNTNVAHLSYIGDSIIGNNVNIGGGFIVANLRHDNTSVRVPVKGLLTDSGLRKFGCIIGDNVKTGINTCIYPGRIIESGEVTEPGEIVR